MKRNANATAVAHGPVNKSKKVVKADVGKTTFFKQDKKVDTNPISAAELAIIQNIDARLQELYYLTDEEDIIGFC